MINGY
jgi:hypothetical protein